MWVVDTRSKSNRRSDYSTHAARDAVPRLFEMEGGAPRGRRRVPLRRLNDPRVDAAGGRRLLPSRRGSRHGTSLGESTPLTTYGGHLSEGYVHGLHRVAEAVQQLHGASVARHVPVCRRWRKPLGSRVYAGAMSAMILRKAG
jgi:hypothetical protein